MCGNRWTLLSICREFFSIDEKTLYMKSYYWVAQDILMGAWRQVRAIGEMNCSITVHRSGR